MEVRSVKCFEEFNTAVPPSVFIFEPFGTPEDEGNTFLKARDFFAGDVQGGLEQ
jgi:hypothetical protein